MTETMLAGLWATVGIVASKAIDWALARLQARAARQAKLDQEARQRDPALQEVLSRQSDAFIERLFSRIEKLETRLGTLEQERDRERAAFDERIRELNAQHAEERQGDKTRISELEAELEKLRERVQTLEAELATYTGNGHG